MEDTMWRPGVAAPSRATPPVVTTTRDPAPETRAPRWGRSSGGWWLGLGMAAFAATVGLIGLMSMESRRIAERTPAQARPAAWVDRAAPSSRVMEPPARPHSDMPGTPGVEPTVRPAPQPAR